MPDWGNRFHCIIFTHAALVVVTLDAQRVGRNRTVQMRVVLIFKLNHQLWFQIPALCWCQKKAGLCTMIIARHLLDNYKANPALPPRAATASNSPAVASSSSNWQNVSNWRMVGKSFCTEMRDTLSGDVTLLHYRYCNRSQELVIQWSIIAGCHPAQLSTSSYPHSAHTHHKIFHPDNKICFLSGCEKYFQRRKYSWEAVWVLIRAHVYASYASSLPFDKWGFEDNWALFSYNINITANKR